MKILRDVQTKEFHSAMDDENFHKFVIPDDLEVVDADMQLMEFSDGLIEDTEGHNPGRFYVYDEGEAPQRLSVAPDDFESRKFSGFVIRGKKREKPNNVKGKGAWNRPSSSP